MADALDTMMEAFGAIGRELDTPDLEPDGGRDDWDRVADKLDALRTRLEDEVLAHLDEAAQILASEDPVAPGNVRTSLAYLTAELAAVHHAAGRRSAADTLFARALRVGPNDEAREELEAAAREPDAFLKLTHARWHHRAGDFAAGDAILRANKRSASDPALKRAITKSLGGPRPMGGSAPALFRLNGFGVGLYGERDRRPDGSYIATHALSALWVPVIAIGAYRVISHGGGAYTFLAKERLSTFAKGWNFALLAAVVLAIGGSVVSSYLSSPTRLASNALEDAQALEEAGEAERAAEAYQGVLDDWGARGGVAPEAAAGLMRVLTSRVEAPLTAARVDEAVRVARRYTGLAEYARGDEATSILGGALGAWADQIGDADVASRAAALRLVDLGAAIASGPEAEALRERSAALHVAIAESLREEWPFEALHHYVEAQAMDEATPIVASLGPSTLADVDADVQAWQQAGGEPAASAHVAELRATLAAWGSDARRTQALESGDAELLAELHELQADDQEVGAALANAKRATGEVDEAIALLSTYGAPGRMSSYAQRSLASCYADGGRLPEADALLTRLVEARLPAFQQAQQAYDSAAESRIEALVDRARAGAAPSLNRRLEGVYDESRTQEILNAWLREQIEADESLTALREAYGAQANVVPTVLTLGTLKLRRAREAAGDERQAFLTEAERLFLAIRQEAEGVPAYHLSLGQVYHRLGRVEEGEAELRGLLASGDPAMALQVGSIYRELGLVERAREVATQVYENSAQAGGELSEQHRLGAAQLMALMATTLDDREMWLNRAPEDSPAVRTELLDVRAMRALRERNLPEANRLFAEVARHYEEEGADNSAALNNAAIADMNRYRCDGSVAHLDRAAGRMQRSLALSPDNALLIGNYGELEAYRADVRVLDSVVRARTLRLSSEEADALVGWMLEGPRREEVLAALRADPQARHARELTEQEQVLAPQRPRAWRRQWRWVADTEDLPARRALLARLGEVSNLDRSQANDARRERTQAQQESRRREMDAAVGDADAIVESARRTRHAPTTAAALHLLANVLLARAWETGSVEDATRAVGAARQGREVWDGFGDAQLAWAIVEQAALQLAQAQPAVQARLDEQRSDLSLVFLLEAAARRSPDVVTALQSDPLLDEACELRAALAPERLSLNDILLGELAAHAGLTSAAAAVRSREATRLDLDIREALDPDDAEVASRRAILDG